MVGFRLGYIFSNRLRNIDHGCSQDYVYMSRTEKCTPWTYFGNPAFNDDISSRTGVTLDVSTYVGRDLFISGYYMYVSQGPLYGWDPGPAPS